MKCRVHLSRDAVKMRTPWQADVKPYPICEACMDEYIKIGAEKVLGPLEEIPAEMEEKYQRSLEEQVRDETRSKLRGRKMK